MTNLAAASGSFTTETKRDLQSIGELGFLPRALVAWWTGPAEHGAASGNRGGIGFWTEHGCSAVAWSSEHAAPSIRTAHGSDDAALLGVRSSDGGIVMRAEIESFAGNGVTLRWTTPPAERWIVHYLALGGSVTGAQAGWLSSGEPVGLASPDLVLLVPSPSEGEERAGELMVGIGAATRDRQAVAAYATRTGGSPGMVSAAQRHDAAAVAFDPGGDSASVGRLTPSFTLEWDRVPLGRRYAYLAIAGMRAMVGTADSPRRPDARRTRVGFRPEALLAFTWGLPASDHPKRIGRMCLGAAVRDTSGCASWDDCNVETEMTRTHIASSDTLLLVADTQTGGVHAQAAVSAFDDRGFTLDWRRSDGRRREFHYVALASRGGSTEDERGGVRARLSRVLRSARAP